MPTLAATVTQKGSKSLIGDYITVLLSASGSLEPVHYYLPKAGPCQAGCRGTLLLISP